MTKILESARLSLIGKAYPSLQEFQCSLVLGHFEQLHGALLVRSMAGDLADEVSDEFAVFRLTLR